jgi:hypothetical protein
MVPWLTAHGGGGRVDGSIDWRLQVIARPLSGSMRRGISYSVSPIRDQMNGLQIAVFCFFGQLVGDDP